MDTQAGVIDIYWAIQTHGNREYSNTNEEMRGGI